MVYFMENPDLKWMIGTSILGNPQINMWKSFWSLDSHHNSMYFQNLYISNISGRLYLEFLENCLLHIDDRIINTKH